MGVLPLKHNIAWTLNSHWSSCRGPPEQFPSSHFSFPYSTAMVSDWDRTVGGRRSEPKTESMSDELWWGTSLPLLRISDSMSSILWRCEIFNKSPPMSRSSSTLARRSSPKSSDSASLVEGKWGLCNSSCTKDRKSFSMALLSCKILLESCLNNPGREHWFYCRLYNENFRMLSAKTRDTKQNHAHYTIMCHQKACHQSIFFPYLCNSCYLHLPYLRLRYTDSSKCTVLDTWIRDKIFQPDRSNIYQEA